MGYIERERALLAELKQLIDRAKELFFTDPKGEYATDAATLGILVSKALRWEFGAILEAVYAAFEDANFDTFGDKVVKLADGENDES